MHSFLPPFGPVWQPSLNCIFRDGLCASRYMYRLVLATSYVLRSNCTFLSIWLASAPFVLNWANPFLDWRSQLFLCTLHADSCRPEFEKSLKLFLETKDRVDIIIGMVCNGCGQWLWTIIWRSWLLFLRLLHAISVAFVCFSEYYLCEFNQRGSLSTCTFRLMFTTINSQ